MSTTPLALDLDDLEISTVEVFSVPDSLGLPEMGASVICGCACPCCCCACSGICICTGVCTSVSLGDEPLGTTLSVTV